MSRSYKPQILPQHTPWVCPSHQSDLALPMVQFKFMSKIVVVGQK